MKGLATILMVSIPFLFVLGVILIVVAKVGVIAWLLALLLPAVIAVALIVAVVIEEL